MAFNLLSVRPAMADGAHFVASKRENEAVRRAVNIAERKVADFAVIEAIVGDDHSSFHVHVLGPRQRNAMLGNVDGVFSGSKVMLRRYLYPQKHTLSRLLGVQKPIWIAVFGARRSHLGKYARNARGASSESNKILRDDGTPSGGRELRGNFQASPDFRYCS
jgi:hypothetical protein